MSTLSHAAHHHAGHYVALSVAGKAQLVDKLTLAGLTKASAFVLEGSLEEVDALLVAVYAGYAAEARFDPVASATLEHSPEDEALSESYLDLIAPTRSREEKVRSLRRRAVDLVAAHWSEICAIADELNARGHLAEEDADVLMEAVNDPGSQAVLALRRGRHCA